jgi:hypothetical protein
VRSVIRFYGQTFPPAEIHRELVTMYGTNVMTVQNVHKWCRDFDSSQWMKKGVVSRPGLLIFFRILMQQCKQTYV